MALGIKGRHWSPLLGSVALVSGVYGQTVQDISRWTSGAATAPAQGYTMGSPLTLTWGIIPDGTTTGEGGTSNLIATFDATFGAGGGGANLTNRPWFSHFSNSFDRWSQLSGLSYVYSAADDGVAQLNANRGILGQRADIRIGGKLIDGSGGVLAFNYFPNHGDMVLDTGDMSLFSNANNSYRFLRNVIMHEHGHGLGCQHCESSDRGFLMEPFLQTTFDGPQFHDILLIQRGYGDFFEKSNGGLGNDTAARATHLGSLSLGSQISIGNDARDLPVGANETDFVSIDDQTDTDFFSFSLTSAATVNVLLESLGGTYNVGPQGGSQVAFNTQTRSDLALSLFDMDGTTMLQSANLTGLGGNEQISLFLNAPGTYFVRVTGVDNSDSIALDTQFYGLSVQAVPEPGTIAALAIGGAFLMRRRKRSA